LAAAPAGVHSVNSDLFQFLCASIDPAKPVLERSAASTTLAKARLSEDQLLALADMIKAAGPLELTKLLSAYEHSHSEAVGTKLVASLKEAKGVSSLRPDLVKTVLTNYPAAVQEQSEALLTTLNVDASKQSAHIEELLKDLKT